MISYKDRTYCASPDCRNECGRQLTQGVKDEARESGLPLALGLFCGGSVGKFMCSTLSFPNLEEE